MLTGDFYGTVIEVDALTDLCVVQVDDEEQALIGVKWYDEPPDMTQCGFWQICYPIIEQVVRNVDNYHHHRRCDPRT
jgi:hypothetical protein